MRRLIVTSTENVAFRTRGKRSLRAAAVDPTSPPFYSNEPTKFPVFDLGMSVENENKRRLLFLIRPPPPPPSEITEATHTFCFSFFAHGTPIFCCLCVSAFFLGPSTRP